MYKKHSSFCFIAELFVPNLSEHERPGAIGMLKAGVRVSGVARYYNCLPAAKQYLRDCHQATRTVKGRHMPDQLIMVTDIKTATNADYIDDINIDDIHSCWPPTLPENSGAPRVICFRFLIKIFYYNNFISCRILRPISNCSFRI